MENPKDILEKLLKSHDWWYMMSDDPRVYDKGSKEEEAIKLLKDKVGSEYDTLYNKYAPEEFKTMVDYKYTPKNPKALEEQEDKIDTISMDVPLFIRMLEYAKEDAAEDVDLHDVTEKANLLCKERGILSMEDYDEIISSTEDKPLDESKEQESGLWVYSRGREETNKLKEIIDNSDYYGEYNSEVGGFFFPESEDNYDKLEEDLTELFDKNNLDNYRFEGVFGLDESKQDQVFKELKPAKHEFVKRYGKDAEKVMRKRSERLS